MSLESGKCDVCDKPSTEFTLFGDMEMCDECFKSLVMVMQYKNFNDMNEEEKSLLQKFCNKLVKQILTTNE